MWACSMRRSWTAIWHCYTDTSAVKRIGIPDHRPIRRDVPGSKVAVLMLHGILSSPAHFRNLVPLFPEDWTLHAIVLDGHDKGVREFGASSMKKWREQAMQEAAELLEAHDKLIVVAHSMGTLFATRIALAYPDRIGFLFLLNFPSRPRLTLTAAVAGVQILWGKPEQYGRCARAMIEDTGIPMEPYPWKYLGWIGRFSELFREAAAMRKALPYVKVPVCAFSSLTDQLVAPRAVKDLKKNPDIDLTLLRSSGHFGYSEEDTAMLQCKLALLIKSI